MKNNKGLSGIVTTLIIILLVLGAVVVISPVIKKLVSGTSSQLGDAQTCTAITFAVQKVINANYTATNGNMYYNVTLQRQSGGPDTAVGAQLIFYDNGVSVSPSPIDFGKTFKQYDTNTARIDSGSASNSTEVEVIPYYLDSSNNKHLCSGGEKTPFTA